MMYVSSLSGLERPGRAILLHVARSGLSGTARPGHVVCASSKATLCERMRFRETCRSAKLQLF